MTQKIICAQNANFALKLSQNRGFLSTNLAFLEEQPLFPEKNKTLGLCHRLKFEEGDFLLPPSAMMPMEVETKPYGDEGQKIIFLLWVASPCGVGAYG